MEKKTDLTPETLDEVMELMNKPKNRIDQLHDLFHNFHYTFRRAPNALFITRGDYHEVLNDLNNMKLKGQPNQIKRYFLDCEIIKSEETHFALIVKDGGYGHE